MGDVYQKPGIDNSDAEYFMWGRNYILEYYLEEFHTTEC
jgi:hypothetical protein